MEKANAWTTYEGKDLVKLTDLNEDYKEFLSNGKTERECVRQSVALAKKAGYKDLNEMIASKTPLKTGDKVYRVWMEKTIVLFQIGKEPLEAGLNILGAHIDSPRLDLKQNPLYEDTEMALLDTHYYGGVKKYQWVTLPMALHGVVVKKDGTKIELSIGEKEDEPVVGITDLLIHLSGKQMEKKASVVIEGEDLNVLIGSRPLKGEEKDAVKKQMLDLLKEEYNIEEEDFLSAEIEVVPAGKARDFGLDRSMVMSYGQDDRVCAYTSLVAMLNVEAPQRTSCCVLVDKEEIGSVGATGMHSKFFENTVAEILALSGDYNDLVLRRTLANSYMLSSDVSAAFDPNYPAVMEKKNSAYFGKGLVLNKYTGARGKSGSNDANPEFIAKLRKIFDEEGVAFQTAELGRVDIGGGGTIAYIPASYGMNVIDCGVAVLNMHAPWEITSKSDIYEVEKGYEAFLTHCK
ncbi:aminopeptidase [Anaerostipes sp. MSJ-23]|uniref:aminopeptidase n=1 Tax=Anaerostipes sp. MSJ-23 TaxID=2841520 RepID=UPI001C0F7391|nr:aminopeptidase [Anaerostipes sp. MSJ-23]MBU5458850.1 aminopeptidase [Anaerostipes sp. MSJ-23]